MISVENVKKIVESIGGFDNCEIDNYDVLIQNAIATVCSQIKDDTDSGNSRIEMLVAAMVNYQLAIITSNDDVSSFKAGDISFTQNTEKVKNAKQLLDNAKENAFDLIIDNGFAFLGV